MALTTLRRAPSFPAELARHVHIYVLVAYLEDVFDLSTPFCMDTSATPSSTWDALQTLSQVDHIWRFEALGVISELLGIERGRIGSGKQNPWHLMRLMKRYLITMYEPTKDYKAYVRETSGALQVWSSSIKRSATLRVYFVAICAIGRLNSGIYKQDLLRSRFIPRIHSARNGMTEQKRILGVQEVAANALHVLDQAERIEVAYIALTASLRVRDLIVGCVMRGTSLQASIIVPDDLARSDASIPMEQISTLQSALDTFSKDMLLHAQDYKNILEARGGRIRDLVKCALDGIEPCAKFVTDEAEEIFRLRALWSDIQRWTKQYN